MEILNPYHTRLLYKQFLTRHLPLVDDITHIINKIYITQYAVRIHKDIKFHYGLKQNITMYIDGNIIRKTINKLPKRNRCKMRIAGVPTILNHKDIHIYACVVPIQFGVPKYKIYTTLFDVKNLGPTIMLYPKHFNNNGITMGVFIVDDKRGSLTELDDEIYIV